MDQHEVPFNVVMGAAVRRLRARQEWSQDDLARAVRDKGLTWTRPTVADVESGRKSLLLSEALVIADVFDRPLRSIAEVGLDAIEQVGRHPDLVAVTEGLVSRIDRFELAFDSEGDFYARELELRPGGRVSKRSKVPGPEDLRAMGQLSFGDMEQDELVEVARRTRAEAEQRIARQLGVTPTTLVAAAYGLWGHSLVDEREECLREMGADEAPLSQRRALRGHITRQLVAALKQRLGEGD